MTGAITLVDADFVIPGDRAHVRFALDREGSRTIGAGIIVDTDD